MITEDTGNTRFLRMSTVQLLQENLSSCITLHHDNLVTPKVHARGAMLHCGLKHMALQHDALCIRARIVPR